MRRDHWIELLLVVSFATCVCFQLFVPPSIGLANNGDFGKMIGRFDLGPEDSAAPTEYDYVITHWKFDTQYHWISDNVSSELILIFCALLIGWKGSVKQFDIRTMGAVHAVLWIACFAVLLVLLRRLPSSSRWLTALAALFMFTDVSYVALCNSFYTDAGAFLFLGWATVLWLLLMLRPQRSLPLSIAFSIASVLFVLTKPQHAPLGLFLFALGLVAGRKFEKPAQKTGAVAIALIIPLAAWAEYWSIPFPEMKMPQYGVVFGKILEGSPTPAQDLRELGLGPEYARYIGQGRTALADPIDENQWWADYLSKVTPGRVLQFHLRHPWRTAVFMYRDMNEKAADRRLQIFGKYDRESGYGAKAQARSFYWWTSMRSALFRLAPWHIVAWFAAVGWICVRLALRRSGSAAGSIAILCLLLTAMASVEFLISSLADSGETERHLFLFQVLTDFTILGAIVWVTERFSARRGATERQAGVRSTAGVPAGTETRRPARRQ